MSTPIKVTTQSIDLVLEQLGWRATPSLIEDRRRIYDESGLLVNVCTEWETWTLLQQRGLVSLPREHAYEDLVREVQTAIGFSAKGGRK